MFSELAGMARLASTRFSAGARLARKRAGGPGEHTPSLSVGSGIDHVSVVKQHRCQRMRSSLVKEAVAV